jgi:glycogen operon protein
MLVAGDEFGRSQRGNNNAYCHDDEISWIDWQGIDDEGRALLEFTRELVRFRRLHDPFHRNRFLASSAEHRDIRWLRSDGNEMTREDWENGGARTLAFLLSGEPGSRHLTERGNPVHGETFFVMLNAHDAGVVHRLPGEDSEGERWELVIATADEARAEAVARRAGEGYEAPARSVSVFVRRSGSR